MNLVDILILYIYYINFIYLLDFVLPLLLYCLTGNLAGAQMFGWMDVVPLVQEELGVQLPAAHMAEWPKVRGLGTPGINNSGWYT